MPLFLDINDLIVDKDVEQKQRWVGFFVNKSGTFINLGNPNMRKSLVLNNSEPNNFCICLFHCPNSGLIRDFDKFHRMTRSSDSANFYVINELKRREFFKAVSEIRSDLSGLTNANLKDLREGMKFLSRKLNNLNSYEAKNGVSVASFREDRIHSWEITQELRSGKY